MCSCIFVYAETAPAENTWEFLEPMPTNRAFLGVVALNNKIYAIGGECVEKEKYKILNTNEMYDPTLNSWIIKQSMPTPRSSFGIAVYGNSIYCIGGLEQKGTALATKTAVNEVYDTITDTWMNLTSMPTPRAGLTANIVNGKIYLKAES
jgi:N-acetylneuraminic acid mutarotase